jgi:hypothetical protein
MYQRTERPSSKRAAATSSGLSVAGPYRRQVQHDAQPAAAQPSRTQGLQRQAVAEQQVVRHLHGGARGWLMPGANTPCLVAQHRHHPGLVVGGDARPRGHRGRARHLARA